MISGQPAVKTALAKAKTVATAVKSKQWAHDQRFTSVRLPDGAIPRLFHLEYPLIPARICIDKPPFHMARRVGYGRKYVKRWGRKKIYCVNFIRHGSIDKPSGAVCFKVTQQPFLNNTG